METTQITEQAHKELSDWLINLGIDDLRRATWTQVVDEEWFGLENITEEEFDAFRIGLGYDFCRYCGTEKFMADGHCHNCHETHCVQ